MLLEAEWPPHVVPAVKPDRGWTPPNPVMTLFPAQLFRDPELAGPRQKRDFATMQRVGTRKLFRRRMAGQQVGALQGGPE